MKRYATIFFLIAITLVTAADCFSQNDTAADMPMPEARETVSDADVEPAANALKDISIYGEVQAVDAGSGKVTVQYYDYDSDNEKTIELAVDADTKFENAEGVKDMKKGDWVDAIYVVKDGKSIAKSVLVEKEEPVQAAQ